MFGGRCEGAVRVLLLLALSGSCSNHSSVSFSSSRRSSGSYLWAAARPESYAPRYPPRTSLETPAQCIHGILVGLMSWLVSAASTLKLEGSINSFQCPRISPLECEDVATADAAAAAAAAVTVAVLLLPWELLSLALPPKAALPENADGAGGCASRVPSSPVFGF